MVISSASNDVALRPPVAPTSRPGGGADGILPGDEQGVPQTHTLAAASVVDTVELTRSAGDAGQGTGGRVGAEATDRVANAADGFQQRVDNLLDVTELSDEQTLAIEEVQSEFTAIVSRIQNALEGDGLAPQTLAAGFQFAVGTLVEGVRDAQRPEPTLPPVDAPGPTRIDGDQVTSDRIGGGPTGADGDPQGISPEQRIDGFLERLDQRLGNLAEVEGLDRAQIAELNELRDTFAASLDRFENAFFGTGDANHERIGRTFAQLLSGFAGDVSGVLQGEPTQPGVQLYGADGAVSPLTR